MNATPTAEPQQVLQRVFGYDEFRGQQQQIIDTVSAGLHALVLMPTGGGKSLCYQIPALCGAATVVVISPLIALMEDQVNAVRQLGVRAAFLNSSLSAADALQVRESLLMNELDLLYLAPERLLGAEMIDLLHRTRIGLFAIDEAHCLSQWGHDFRADYLGLSVLETEFPGVPRMALTATADQRTRAEIQQHLGFSHDNSRSFVDSFDRPNIVYEIAPAADRRSELLQFIKHREAGNCGIVYCQTRKGVEQTTAYLTSKGVHALAYHAGMDVSERRSNQLRFLNEDAVVMVATIAFGMGIDKPDVRFVAHLNLPKNIESYYQETGRAGRDGQPAVAWMRYSTQDVIGLRHMLRQSEADDRHKQVVSSKLEAMLGFAEMVTCRRHRMLDYFGESSLPTCGNCDNCISPPETYDATVVVQKALSCVYRTGQRYGVKYVVDVLTGVSNERIQRAGHDLISTFGIGCELPASEWQGIFRQLIARGLLHADLENYGVLQLTERARPALRGEEQIQLRKPALRVGRQAVKRVKDSTANPPAELSGDEIALFEVLKKVRSEQARESGIAPYMVFHDSALIEMAQIRPRSELSFLEISGVGEKKLERFGAAFIQAIRASGEIENSAV